MIKKWMQITVNLLISVFLQAVFFWGTQVENPCLQNNLMDWKKDTMRLQEQLHRVEEGIINKGKMESTWSQSYENWKRQITPFLQRGTLI